MALRIFYLMLEAFIPSMCCSPGRLGLSCAFTGQHTSIETATPGDKLEKIPALLMSLTGFLGLVVGEAVGWVVVSLF